MNSVQSNIRVRLNGEDLELGTNPMSVMALKAEKFGVTDRTIIVAKVDGELVDLSYVLTPRCSPYVVEFVSRHQPEGVKVLRHSTAHLLAQAVQMTIGFLAGGPRIGQGVGPVIEGGFYQDFDFGGCGLSLTEQDLPPIEGAMRKLVSEGNKYARREISKAEALELFANDPYKVELLKDKIPGETVSVYSHGHGYYDLCRGPHVPSSDCLGDFKLLEMSGSYWLGDSSRQQLTRIYGTAEATHEDLVSALHRREEASRRDHRIIGPQMELIYLPPEAVGSCIFLPRGNIIRLSLMDLKRQFMTEYGYQEVSTPTIFSTALYAQSGHLENYRDSMFMLEHRDDKSGDDAPQYALKPMNCPGHCLIYKLRQRSYRELPLRIAEFGHVHRNELRGALNGLLRVRSFCQDDAHLFVAENQLHDEVRRTIEMYQRFYTLFGFESVKVELSTRPPKRLGTDALWDNAEEALSSALRGIGMDYSVDAGGGAFYGPKIDFKVTDCLGRSWQIGTIQADYQLPQRFGLKYVTADNSQQQPIMIHPATMGSLERFIAILIEHYEGRFPTWLAPVQVNILTVSDKSEAYARRVIATLIRNGIRTASDLTAAKLGKKIVDSHSVQAPYILVLGERDAAASAVSVRDRAGGSINNVPLQHFIDSVTGEIRARRQSPFVAKDFQPLTTVDSVVANKQ